MSNKMEYNVTIILTLFRKGREQFSSGYRELKLPFAPFIGLALLNNSPMDFGKIERITWVESENRFSCSIDYESKGSDDDLEFLISEAKKQGYQKFDQIYDS
jgi:hypothetical protein